MKDIVGRLRDGLSSGPNTVRTPWGLTIEEAAGAIERMQAEIERLSAQIAIMYGSQKDGDLYRALENDLKRLWHFAGCPYDHCQTCIDDANFIRSLEDRLGPPSAQSVQAQREG